MKIKVTMKGSGTMPGAVLWAVKQEVLAMGLPDDEQEALIELRYEKELGIMAKWFKFSELLTVEFDTISLTAVACDAYSITGDRQ